MLLYNATTPIYTVFGHYNALTKFNGNASSAFLSARATTSILVGRRSRVPRRGAVAAVVIIGCHHRHSLYFGVIAAMATATASTAAAIR